METTHYPNVLRSGRTARRGAGDIAGIANHRPEFDSSCLLAELAIYII